MGNPLRSFGLWLAGEKKSKTTGETLPRWQLGRPYTPPTPVITTEQAVRRGYTRASVVYACIRLIADTSTSVPLRVYDRRGENDWEHLPDHPLQQLLDTPNARLTRRRMYLRLIQHLQLTGNAMWTKIRVPKNGPATQLWPVNPDLITPIPDARNMVAYYELRVDGQAARIETRDLIHIQLENPETPWWGIGPLQAAMQDTDLYLGNKAWNLRTVQRGAVTPGVLEIPEDLNTEQYKALREQLDNRTFGNDDAGRELILGSGMKYHRMSLTGEELGFLESMRFGREEIAMVFGVPVAMLTPENATLANVEAYNKQFWENTIVPLNTGIADMLTQALVPDYGETSTNLVIAHDYSQVPAMQDSLDDQSQTAERLVRTGFTVEGVNRLLDLGFEEDEIKPPMPAPDFTPNGGQDDQGPPQADEERAALGPTRQKQLDGLWARTDAYRQSWETEVAARVSALFRVERDMVVAAWRERENAAAVETAIVRHEAAWAALLTTVHQEAGAFFALDEYDRLTPKARKQLEPDVISLEWARRHAARQVTHVSNTTREALRAIITTGLTADADGYRRTVDQIADDIADTYDTWQITGPTPALTIEGRAMLIARTELGTAVNHGHQEGARAAAAEYGLVMDKGWSSSRDDRVRDSHAMLHGEIVGMDDAFSNGLQYPGDPDGPIEEIANCRCVVFHQVRRGS